MTDNTENKVVIKSFAEIEAKKTEWLWPDKIPLGTLSLIVGYPNSGKTFLTMFIASRVTTGESWPDIVGDGNIARSVIIFTAEDDLNRTVRIRLEAAGADLNRVKIVFRSIEHGNEKCNVEILNLSENIPLLEKSIQEVGDVGLVIIDPITAYMGGKNQNSNSEVRDFLTPLTKLAEKHNVAIIGLSHFNKNFESKAIYRAMGSVGFIAAARAVWAVVLDQNNKDRRLFLPVKLNLAKEPKGLAYRLVDTEISKEDNIFKTALCEFESGAVDITIESILDIENSQKKTTSCITEATEFLTNILSEGSKPANEIVEQAKNAGISGRTLGRAKARLNIKSEQKRTEGQIESWIWSLPKELTKQININEES
ncbi:MAG: AAA family ATPase [Planctomycetaceae bacterium]|nr:AAA family ATPase [Planctomycetaceae bacterium]